MKKVIASPKAPKAVGPYSQAIAHDATLYISGQLPIDGATGVMAEGVEAQTRQALTNLGYILQSHRAKYTLRTNLLFVLWVFRDCIELNVGDYLSLTEKPQFYTIHIYSKIVEYAHKQKGGLV